MKISDCIGLGCIVKTEADHRIGIAHSFYVAMKRVNVIPECTRKNISSSAGTNGSVRGPGETPGRLYWQDHSCFKRTGKGRGY